MYKTNNFALIENNIALELIREQGIYLRIHWLNPLLFKNKSSYNYVRQKE